MGGCCARARAQMLQVATPEEEVLKRFLEHLEREQWAARARCVRRESGWPAVLLGLLTLNCLALCALDGPQDGCCNCPSAST